MLHRRNYSLVPDFKLKTSRHHLGINQNISARFLSYSGYIQSRSSVPNYKMPFFYYYFPMERWHMFAFVLKILHKWRKEKIFFGNPCTILHFKILQIYVCEGWFLILQLHKHCELSIPAPTYKKTAILILYNIQLVKSNVFYYK